MKLTFFGGIREIGGSKVLLQDKNIAIFLDFGKNIMNLQDILKNLKKHIKRLRLLKRGKL